MKHPGSLSAAMRKAWDIPVIPERNVFSLVLYLNQKLPLNLSFIKFIENNLKNSYKDKKALCPKI